MNRSYVSMLKHEAKKLHGALSKYVNKPSLETFDNIANLGISSCPIYVISSGKYNNNQCNNGCPLNTVLSYNNIKLTPCSFIACGGKINREFYGQHESEIYLYLLKFKLYYEALLEDTQENKNGS